MPTIHNSPFKKSKQIRINAVPNPSAQFERLCEPGPIDFSLLNNVLFYIQPDNKEPLPYKLLVDLMLSGGLRISELLKPIGFKINMLGQVYVQGLKNSNAKLITSLYYRDYWLQHRPYVYNPFMHFSRFGIYRLFKSKELVLINKQGINNSVTHSIRHLSVHLNQLIELPHEELSRIIGHKSYTAINYYLYGEKK